MIVHSKRKKGRGLFNKLINNLPVELHLPGYQFCGPGTKLAKRLTRGDKGINPLDRACKEHDIVYSKNRNIGGARKKADLVLADKAWERVHAPDSSFGERAAALAVTNAMKIKSKMGLGIKRKPKKNRRKRKSSCKKTKFSKVFSAARKNMKRGKKSREVIRSALVAARAAVKNAGGKSKVIVPCVLPMSSKVGGALPFLIPLFAGLSATGALAGGAASVVKAINDARAARESLSESKRHNASMEAIALGKGKGLYLKPYKTGYGLYLNPVKGRGLKKKTSM